MCDCEGDPVTVYDAQQGEEVCINCGVVVERVLDDGRDWSFDELHDTSRVGAPNASLSTCMFGVKGVSKRTMACAVDRADVAARELKAAIQATCAALHIATPSVISTTAEDMFAIHSKAYPGLYGEAKTAAIAACVYYACRAEKADRELRVLSSACQVDMKALNAAAKNVKDSLRASVYADKLVDPSLSALVGKFVDRLGVPDPDRKRLWKECHRILDETPLDSGKKPRTVVGGVLYTASTRLGMGLSKKAITVAAGVCSQTIDKIT